jgi:hypothetical protein
MSPPQGTADPTYPMITTPHLDIEQLLETAALRGPGEEERAHLDACPACQAEFDSWAVVAGGVRARGVHPARDVH